MNILILLAGGIGSRMNMGALAKQFLFFEGRPIISYSLKTFDSHPLISNIIIVADQKWHQKIDKWMKDEGITKFYSYAEPGENRQLSIYNGLKAANKIAGSNDVVIIHDAARPLVSEQLITNCLTSIEDDDGVVPVLPAKDTYYLLNEKGEVSRMLPRPLLAAGQAPEAFKYGAYYDIHRSMAIDQILTVNGSTEMAVLGGLKIHTIPGEERNFKITTQEDLNLMKMYLKVMQ